MVDTLLAVNPADGFTSFCSVLQHCGAPVSARLAQELDTNLRLERGDLKPRQELIDEAAVLVHRSVHNVTSHDRGLEKAGRAVPILPPTRSPFR